MKKLFTFKMVVCFLASLCILAGICTILIVNTNRPDTNETNPILATDEMEDSSQPTGFMDLDFENFVVGERPPQETVSELELIWRYRNYPGQ